VETSPFTGILDAKRLERLVAAGQALVRELDVDTVLRQVLEIARELTGARYAALGVLNEQRTGLRDFITCGVDEETHRAIGDLPHGRGVLGVLIEEPKPLRLHDVTLHPRSYGFPPGHPEMTSFLGTPVVIRGEAWGNLYLTDKDGGDFDEADEATAITLAGWAAIAIENARLYEHADRRRAELERSNRGLEATTTIARAVGGETRLERILELITKRGRALVGARGILIALPDGDDLAVAATAGETPPGLDGARIPVTGDPQAATLRELTGADALLTVPLTFRGRALGVLAAFGRIDGAEAFDGDDEQLMRAFAASAATAVATAQTVEHDRVRHAVRAAEEERKRWARELHDETLQGLAALRLGLSAGARADDADALRTHMRAAVEQLAEEITKLRGIISDLRPAALDQLGLGPALESLGDRSRGDDLDVHLDVDLPSLDPEIETTLYRLVQEALTNVRKHAGASSVVVRARLRGQDAEVVVTDDGRGFDPSRSTPGFGLTGMRERAGLAGGTCEITSSSEGTRVRFSVPTA
jgi:signal transduction histidine kinase